ncbi:MAG TPA: hypothetical protein VFA26_01540 [Gemmataceae bacterium]|nr:hypothetical protein [Gemmataceae bacterium]
MRHRLFVLLFFFLSSLCPLCFCGESLAAEWLLGHAYKIPSQYTNQESGYFSIVEGKNGRICVGAAKYGVNAYLIEFDPKTAPMKMVVDAHKVIGTDAKGFAAQSKFHTRNNVGASGKIYAGTKQGYPEKGEQRTDYKGKPLPWHHTVRKAKDGTLAPWVPMGVCAARDGSVYVMTIAPFTLLKFSPQQLR